jgi:hypothetical protein
MTDDLSVAAILSSSVWAPEFTDVQITVSCTCNVAPQNLRTLFHNRRPCSQSAVPSRTLFHNLNQRRANPGGPATARLFGSALRGCRSRPDRWPVPLLTFIPSLAQDGAPDRDREVLVLCAFMAVDLQLNVTDSGFAAIAVIIRSDLRMLAIAISGLAPDSAAAFESRPPSFVDRLVALVISFRTDVVLAALRFRLSQRFSTWGYPRTRRIGAAAANAPSSRHCYHRSSGSRMHTRRRSNLYETGCHITAPPSSPERSRRHCCRAGRVSLQIDLS